MRRALIVGIDNYPTAPLAGCVNDANRIANRLRRHENGDPNFDCLVLTDPATPVTRPVLRENVERLFKDEADVALFYFSGHGYIDDTHAQFVTADAQDYDFGMSMTEVLSHALNSKAQERIIILDCCHSGAFGSMVPKQNTPDFLSEGISILAASRATQVAMENGGAGVFTSLICDGLDGGASDVLGNVTAANLYAYVDEALGAWDQRPVFKTNTTRFSSIRRNDPIVPLEVLRRLPKYFPVANDEYELDPSFEPTAEPRNPEHERIFSDLQKFRAARLLEPVGTEHMYYAAMESKSCILTPLGQHYWHLSHIGKL